MLYSIFMFLFHFSFIIFGFENQHLWGLPCIPDIMLNQI